jgi:methyl-accepting chemotaxis protein
MNIKWNVGTKIGTGFGLCGILMLVLAGVGYRSASTSLERARWVAHSQQVLGDLSRLLSSLQDAETGSRGYIITGLENYLEPFKTGIAQVEEHRKSLMTLTADNPNQQRRLTDLEPLIRARLAVIQQGIDARRTKTFEAAQAIIMSGEGKKDMDDLRRRIQEMTDEEEGLLKQREAEATQGASVTYWSLGLVTLAGFVLTLIIGFSVSRNIAGPLKKLTAVADRIAAGDLSVNVSPEARSDEVGTLARTFERMTQSLREQMRQLTEGANVLGASASEIVASSIQLAASATESAAAVSETATTVQEVRQTVELASQKAKAVSDSAQKVAQISQSGRKSTEEVVAGMTRIRQQMEAIAACMVRLSEQSQTIGQIVAAVEDLAAQSNLLAVNAAIEAAKAGEHGKGFGVVAQEVKRLAEQSRQATNQVRTILSDIQKATTAAVMATEQGGKAVEAGEKQTGAAGESIQALAGSLTEAAQVAIQIATTGQQQLAGMDQVATAMESIKQASSQNVASAKQLETAASNLNNLGARLKQMVEKYKV